MGVVPPRFAWTMADVYLPLKVTDDPDALLWLSCIKLKPGVSARAAEAEFQPLFEVFAKQAPGHFPETFGFTSSDSPRNTTSPSFTLSTSYSGPSP